MLFPKKEIVLKNGIKAVLKTPEIEDAEMQLNYIKTSCGETAFLTKGAEDYNDTTIEDEEKWIRNKRESENELLIACYIDGVIIGSCNITFLDDVKTYHRASIGIAINQKYWNIGIGSAMFKELIGIAEEHKDTEMLELNFVEGNERGRVLYEKFGFKEVAKIPNANKLKDGTYQNKIYMQKYLTRQ